MPGTRRRLYLACLLLLLTPFLHAQSGPDQPPPVLATLTYDVAHIEGSLNLRCDAWWMPLHTFGFETLRVEATSARLLDVTRSDLDLVNPNGIPLVRGPIEESVTEYRLENPVINLTRSDESVWDLQGRWYAVLRDTAVPDAIRAGPEPDWPFLVDIQGRRASWNATGPLDPQLQRSSTGRLIFNWTHARSVPFEGAVRASGHAYLFVHGPAELTDSSGRHLRMERWEESRQDAEPVFTVRTVREWYLELDGLDLPLGTLAGQVPCSRVEAAGTGRLVLEGATGKAFRDESVLRLTNATAQVEGPFTVFDEGHPPRQAPPPSDPSAARVTTQGSFGVDGRPVFSPPRMEGPDARTLTLAAAVALFAAGVLKYGPNLLAFLFSRLRPERIDHHPLRGRILELVAQRPGLGIGDAARAMGLRVHHASYHVRRLVHANRLLMRRVGRRTVLYPMGTPRATLNRAALQVPALKRAYDALAESSGMDQAALASRFGVGQGAVSKALARLVAHGLVRVDAVGARRRYIVLHAEAP